MWGGGGGAEAEAAGAPGCGLCLKDERKKARIVGKVECAREEAPLS